MKTPRANLFFMFIIVFLVSCSGNGGTVSIPFDFSFYRDDGFANSIYVSGGIVYTAGGYNTNNDEGSGTPIPCYWTDNIFKTDLPHVTSSTPVLPMSIANSIYISDGTVYTAGYYNNGGPNIPCYWINTTEKDLPLGSGGTSGEANSIYISSGTVYIAGHYNNTPCYWINNTTPTDLPL